MQGFGDFGKTLLPLTEECAGTIPNVFKFFDSPGLASYMDKSSLLKLPQSINLCKDFASIQLLAPFIHCISFIDKQACTFLLAL